MMDTLEIMKPALVVPQDNSEVNTMPTCKHALEIIGCYVACRLREGPYPKDACKSTDPVGCAEYQRAGRKAAEAEVVRLTEALRLANEDAEGLADAARDVVPGWCEYGVKVGASLCEDCNNEECSLKAALAAHDAAVKAGGKPILAGPGGMLSIS